MTEKIDEILKNIGGAISIDPRADAPEPPRPTIGDPNCPFCHGLGYVSADVPVGHPRFGKAVPCSCRTDEIQAAQAEHLRRLSSLGALNTKRFDNFLPEGHSEDRQQQASLRQAYERCVAFAEHPQGWRLLHGGFGTGKTHLAAAIANDCLERGESVIFVNTPDLLDHLRSTFSPTSDVGYDELFEQVRTVGLLVLDDLGAESPTAWAQEKLYQILNFRYNEKLPTVITSNQDLNRIEPRIRSRLVDLDLVRKIVIDAPDFRRGNDETETDISSLRLHLHQTFESFDLRRGEHLPAADLNELKAAFEAAQRYAGNPEGWLVIRGGYATGKTHLAAAIANYQQTLHRPVLFVTTADLLDHLRATFSPDSLVRYDVRFNEIKTAPLLVLDDLTVKSATPWAKEKLYQLIDFRYNLDMPTVITTPDPKGELDERLETRVFDEDHNTICGLTIVAYRGGKKRSNLRRKRSS
jgi:DNA replication protein DnaC